MNEKTQNKVGQYQVHPVKAEMLPVHDEERWRKLVDELVEDIKVNGLQTPVLVDAANRVIDGRARLVACEEAKVKPKFQTVDLEGEERIAALVASLDGARRHMTKDERAYLAYKLATYSHGGNRRKDKSPEGDLNGEKQEKKSRAQTAKQLGVSKRAADKWAAVMTHAPDLKEQILKRETTLKAAEQEAYDRRSKQKIKERAKESRWVVRGEMGVVTGDCRELIKQAQPDQFDAIITDPPWIKDALPLYSTLGKIGAKVLKPGGYLLTAVGTQWLLEAGNLLGKHLKYRWHLLVYFTGGNTMTYGAFGNRHRVYLVFQKEGAGRLHRCMNDAIKLAPDDLTDEELQKVQVIDSTKEKGWHRWQQSLRETEQYVTAFCPPDGRILDPMCGSGTVGVSVLRTNKQYSANRSYELWEMDNDTAATARLRLHRTIEELKKETPTKKAA